MLFLHTISIPFVGYAQFRALFFGSQKVNMLFFAESNATLMLCLQRKYGKLIPTVLQKGTECFMEYNVLNFGAVGNGITSDTAAIQAAVNACCAAGGGRVTLPGGHTYRCGALVLGSNMVCRPVNQQWLTTI